MLRRVMGTFSKKEPIADEINRLQEEENYQVGEFLIVADQNNEVEDYIANVEVKQVDAYDVESFWDKLKDAVNLNNSDETENPLQEYGLTEELSEHYLEVLQDNEYLLLVNQNAPLNRVNGGPEPKGYSKENLEENPTTEVNNMAKEDKVKKNKEEPDLTGEEETVEAEKNKTEEPEVTSTGRSKLNIKDPLNADHVEELQDPSAKKDRPEADANYSQEAENAGIKSEDERQ